MATQVTTGLLANDAVTDEKLHADFTATTQSASDNSTSVATTAYVTTAIANLADSAPSTLNTLNELAAALGDDANFSTTVTNSIATKAPLASPSFTGNVGIGESSPDEPLTVGGDIKIKSTNKLHFTNTSDQTSIHAPASNTMAFSTNSSERMRIDSAGDVGIGTTNPVHNLHVKDPSSHSTVRFEGANNNYKSTLLISSTSSGDAGIQYDASNNTYYNFSYGDMHFNVGTGNLSGSYPANERMVIQSAGNVGIGNTNPGGMHANANQLVVGTGSGDQGMSVYAGTSTGRYAFARAVGNNTDAYDGGMAYDGSRNLTFHTNAGLERMRITGAGKVFIGTSNSNAYGGLGDLVFQQSADDLGIGIIDSDETNTLKLINNGTVSKIEQNGAIPIQIKNANSVLAEFDTYAIPKMNFHFAFNNIYAVSTTNDELGNGQGVLILKQQISVRAGSKILIWYDSGQILNNNSSGTNSNAQIAIYVTTNSSAPPNRGKDHMINMHDTDHFMYPVGSMGFERFKMNGMGATDTLSTGGTYYIYVYGGSYNSGSFSFNYQNSSTNDRGASIIWAEVIA